MRASGGRCGQSLSSKAERATPTARSTSATDASGTRATTSSVWGEITSITASVAGSTHSPPMNSFSCTRIWHLHALPVRGYPRSIGPRSEKWLMADMSVTGPVVGGAHGWPFAASVKDLDELGYVEDEWFV